MNYDIINWITVDELGEKTLSSYIEDKYLVIES